jgi:hypothetical protein
MQNDPPTTTLPRHIDFEIQRYGVVVPRVQQPTRPAIAWTFRTGPINENGEPEF